ncbi:hypothetical protein L2U69_16570 [Zavarzinia compransoris]|uniref:hypothetical protein n=1 Tax=Zavarzinia marina TaxID=2911065 RepID=UPI001F159459|nr:hypothetical protein [Zavarzinia marina]MCF4167264.1 hypothetical protein [Zavarzinia marina]
MQEFQGTAAKVAIICPSLGKSCGIARYSHYVADSIQRLGMSTSLMRSSEDLDKEDAGAASYDFILVQHEYGLFDNLSPLGTGETTAKLVGNIERYLAAHPGARAAIVMHTVVLTDHVLNIMNQCLFGSSIPVVNLNSRGCYEMAIPHLEHGVYVYDASGDGPSKALSPSADNRRRDRPTVGSFGLLSPNKKPTLIIDICERAQANFIGNFATNNRTAARELLDYAERLKVGATVFNDFCEEKDLLERLAPMDFGVVTQEPITHWATSGSIRFLFNFGVPILVPYGPQFEDCAEGVIFAHQDEMHFRIDELFASPDTYELACERSKAFAVKYEMSKVYEKFLKMLADTQPSALTDYRIRNFRDQRRSVTMVDMMLTAGVKKGLTSREAEQSVLAACAAEDGEGIALQAAVDEQFEATPFLRYGVACEGLISPYLGAADRLNLLASCSTLPSNLYQVERFLSHDDTLSTVVRRETLRDIQGIQREYHDVVSNKIFSASVTGKLVKQLFPDIYGKADRDSVQRLRRLMQDYVDRIGFGGTAERIPVRIPTLLIIPAAKMISYLRRVGGLTSAEILGLVESVGLPNDIFDDRLPWIEGATQYIAEKTGTPVSAAIGNATEFQTRYRAFKAEFAMMSNEQFVYSALALYFKTQPSRKRLSDIADAIDGKSRTEALLYLSQQPEATLFQSAVVDLDSEASYDDLAKPILVKKIIDEFFLSQNGSFDNSVSEQNFYQISRFWLFNSLKAGLTNDLFREKKSLGLKDRLKAAEPKAPEPIWLPEDILPELLRALSGDAAAPAEAMLFGGAIEPALLEMVAEKAEFIPSLIELNAMVGTTAEMNVQPEPWTGTASQMPQRSRTVTLSPFQERDVGSKSMPIFDPSAANELSVVGLPDKLWVNAWNAISRFTGAKIVGPLEFRRVSPWIISIDQVVEEDEFDFVIVHKGQIDTMPKWLKDEIVKSFHPYFANEVFIIFSKPEVQALHFDDAHVRVARELVPQRRNKSIGKSIGKLLTR